MATVEQIPPLVAGDKLTAKEFLRRYENMPQMKLAELIGGVVYMPSPVSVEHADMDTLVSGWLAYYAAFTPGCVGSSNGTWIMSDEDAPQPDISLRLLPEYGGQSQVEGRYPCGAPEFVIEICLSSKAYDLNKKLKLYERKGVREYMAVLLEEKQLRWHVLRNGVFQLLPEPADHIYRSEVFPGLWLNGQALLDGNMAEVLAILQQGLQSA